MSMEPLQFLKMYDKEDTPDYPWLTKQDWTRTGFDFVWSAVKHVRMCTFLEVCTHFFGLSISQAMALTTRRTVLE